MSLLVDRRIGSSDLHGALASLGVPSELTTLPFGDVALVGRGPEERPIPVGVELKTIGDLMGSMTSGRLSGHQLPGLTASYEWVWLLVEGQYRPGNDGVLEVWRGDWQPLLLGSRRFMYRDLESYLLTLAVKAGIRVHQTQSRRETARWIATLYHWWTDKAFDEHRAHLAIHRKAAVVPGGFVRPTLVRVVAADLPGIGWERSGAVAERFQSVRSMVNADEAEWREIDGIGKKLAKQIVEALA